MRRVTRNPEDLRRGSGAREEHREAMRRRKTRRVPLQGGEVTHYYRILADACEAIGIAYGPGDTRGFCDPRRSAYSCHQDVESWPRPRDDRIDYGSRG